MLNVSNGFYGDSVSCKVKFRRGWTNYNIDSISDVYMEHKFFKNSNHYILSFIDYMKENILKKCQNLNNVTIELLTYDKDNILHQLIVTVSLFIKDFLKLKHQSNFKKSVFVVVCDDNIILFTGVIDFSGV
jgi:hypothetical protein